MSVVIWPLQQCIARPDNDGERFPLVEHLQAVAHGTGQVTGSPEERLGFLAGLCHDVAKAAAGWQHYIRNLATVKKGPPHSPLGAALFAFWADDLIPRWVGDRNAKRRLFDLTLDWTRLIYDHHGQLDDLPLDVAPWNEGVGGGDLPGVLESCDRPGMEKLVQQFFPECVPVLATFPRWLAEADDRWHRRRRERILVLREVQQRSQVKDVPLAQEGMRLPRLGAQLIFADRSHAAEWKVNVLTSEVADKAAQHLEWYCQEEGKQKLREGAHPGLVMARAQTQAVALQRYRNKPGELAYTLLLPTGYGKTLNGLRVALEACRLGRCKRLVYVAPYLSILSQVVDAIRKSTGLEVFMHHHLTPALLEDHQPYDVLETWQTPVLATTFNQLFRVLFPLRAQQCLRIRALEGAFVFIDEPQIIDVSVWNLFLRALAVVGTERGSQVLLSTATLPPTEDGLGKPALPLAEESCERADKIQRYQMRTLWEPWGPTEVAERTRQQRAETGSVATILNTVRDAVGLYELLEMESTPGWHFLAAMMLPGHKSKRIDDIRDQLRRGQSGERSLTGVVCTQVLEAGVDLSFRSLLRALPVFSSVAQAAGRANRHGESDQPAEIVVFPFRREDGKDSRPYVYRDETALRQTDAILRGQPDMPEPAVMRSLADYYNRCRQENHHRACLDLLEHAARGKWSAVAGLKPFDDGAPECEVFVPGSEGYLPLELTQLMKRFAAGGAEELLNRYLDRQFRKSLSFLDRKRMSALLRQFTVGVPRRLAERIATPIPDYAWLWVLDDPKQYSDATGLAHLLGSETDHPSCLLC